MTKRTKPQRPKSGQRRAEKPVDSEIRRAAILSSLTAVELPLVVASRPLDRAYSFPTGGAESMDAFRAVVRAVTYELGISRGEAAGLVGEHGLVGPWSGPRGLYRKVMRRVGPRIVLASVRQTSPGLLRATVYVARRVPGEGRRATPVANRGGSHAWMQRALQLAFRGEFTTNVNTGAANENSGEL
jgi:hypothetical protein